VRTRPTKKSASLYHATDFLETRALEFEMVISEERVRSDPTMNVPSYPVAPMTTTVFHQPWWLKAASGGRYEEATVTDRDVIVGRLPYVITRKFGFRVLEMPCFTHVLGPCVQVADGKPQTKLTRQMTIIESLVERLPYYDYFKQISDPFMAEGLAFQHCGFQIMPQYNFSIDCRGSIERIWMNLSSNTRNHIRRAEKDFDVAPIYDAELFRRFYASNLTAGRRDRVQFETFPELFDQCRTKQQGALLGAFLKKTPVAMAFFVWDNDSMYYNTATRAPCNSAGAMNLLVWNAIKLANQKALTFDFDGVVKIGTMRFFSGFGGNLTSRLLITKRRPAYALLSRTKGLISNGDRDESYKFT
jgi:hypothetical protein